MRVDQGRRQVDVDPLVPRSTLYALFMQVPAAICVLRGPEHIFELVNPGYQQLFKGRRLLGLKVREALPELEGQGYFEILDRVYESDEAHNAREARVMLDREMFFDFIYQPMHSEDRKVEGVIVFAFDVTDEVNARQRGEERLRQTEEMFRLLVESVHDYAIFMLDLDGRVASWNPGARRIKGYEPEEIIGQHFAIFYSDEDVRAGKPEGLLARARERGRIEDEGWRVRKDGSKFWADTVITAIHGVDGDLRGFAKVTRDVTERKKSEEMERALVVAKDVNQAKDDFLAVISHEMRTPLTAILGWARMLRIGDLDEQTTHEALTALERSAQTQVHLIEDLLDDTRIKAGKLQLTKRPIEIRSIIESALADLAPQADGKRIRMTSDLECESCSIVGDPTRLQQVVSNVVSNAIKFTPAGGSIFVRLERTGSDARIEVRDNGRGINAELLQQLFHRFRQGDASSGRKAGIGLGLAISKYLVEQHGGTIKAASDGPGKGATFTIELPLTIEVSDEFTLREPNRAAELPDLSGIRVLIVEDEADNRDVLSKVLQRCGAAVHCSVSAEEGLHAVQSWRPDAIVCDIALPGVDGCEFIRQVRSRFPTPALALTVFGSSEEEARVRECGFDVFRQKPIEPADLAHEIMRLSRHAVA